MGKKQHQSDKLYITSKEWTSLYGGKRANDEYHSHSERSEFKRLPYDHCSLSLQPFRDPYITSNGVIYDLTNIVPFLQKYGVDPYSGEKLQAKQLTKLNFQKNADGFYHCPVLFKVFNQNSHIVAIKTTGNVFSYEAVEQLNLKAGHFRDLLNDQPFTKKDIIDIQNPQHLDKFNIMDFYYIKNNLLLKNDDEDSSNLRKINNETKETLKELETVEENALLKKMAGSSSGAAGQKPGKADHFSAAHYSTGRAAASFTSTVMEPVVSVEAAILDEFVIRYPYVKKKGYVRLTTNLGNLNLELHCETVTKTCDNFMTLCKRGYYDGTKFHRLIKNFMIQGGDPTGTGRGGESAFARGEPFEDEFNKLYSHEGRGILSMANSGPDSNKSQFFITFRSCKHLDNKHTIFGRVVGGLEVLSRMEATKVDDGDRPLEAITILKTTVFVDPYREAEELIASERTKMGESSGAAGLLRKRQQEEAAKPKKVFRQGIGSFINLDDVHKKISGEGGGDEASKSKKARSTFGNFDSW